MVHVSDSINGNLGLFFSYPSYPNLLWGKQCRCHFVTRNTHPWITGMLIRFICAPGPGEDLADEMMRRRRRQKRVKEKRKAEKRKATYLISPKKERQSPYKLCFLFLLWTLFPLNCLAEKRMRMERTFACFTRDSESWKINKPLYFLFLFRFKV